jgi:hypothetical protein
MDTKSTVSTNHQPRSKYPPKLSQKPSGYRLSECWSSAARSCDFDLVEALSIQGGILVSSCFLTVKTSGVRSFFGWTLCCREASLLHVPTPALTETWSHKVYFCYHNAEKRCNISDGYCVPIVWHEMRYHNGQ